MAERFADDVAVVTGAGARSERGLGIGEATARAFGEEGATVVAVDVDGDMAGRTADMIEDAGGEAVGLAVDITDEPAVAALADTIEERFGRVDALVNNAGIRIEGGPVTDLENDALERIVDVNLEGAFRCCKHLLPHMPEGSAVVNVASANATVGRGGWTAYDATKAGLLALTRDMAADHAGEGIRANAVSPGWTITDYHLPEDPEAAEERIEEQTTRREDGPGILKRNALPEEQAAAILFLASDAASYVTGTNLHVDGGLNAVGHGVGL